jgi:outer membrane protein OmpA-like peptidoglycan-associated protein
MARKCSEGSKDPSSIVAPPWLAALACLVMFLWSGAGVAKVEDAVSATDGCSDAALRSAESATSLRSFADRCKQRPQIAINALAKLNALPLPAPTVRFSPQTQGEQPDATVQREQQTLQATIYFGIGETFPTEDGLAALATLVEQVNQFHGQVKSVSILGGADAAEGATLLGRSLAQGRAELLRRYMTAAGMRKVLIVAIGTTAVGDLTSNSVAAQDRIGHIVVVIERRAAHRRMH